MTKRLFAYLFIKASNFLSCFIFFKMSTPTKEELPRIADTLKSELESEHKLKHTTTQEKVVLPSKTGTYSTPKASMLDIDRVILSKYYITRGAHLSVVTSGCDDSNP